MSGYDDRALDAHRELYEITRALRLRLQWQARAGTYGVSALASPRPEGFEPPVFAAPARGERDERERDRPFADESAPEPSSASPVEPARARPYQPAGDSRPAVSVAEAIGFSSMSEALANALGEESERAPRASARARAATTPASTQAPTSAPAPTSTLAPTSTPPAAPEAPPPRPTLAQVRQELGECTRCKLAPTRHNLVFGVGHPDADLMFIGEAPGEQEDLRGEPFVGAAGQLLDKMIAAMGWSRDTVYIANVLKCRPPSNRDPEPDEVASCRPFLERQIAAVQPRLIITLGRPAAHLVLETTESISRLRGSFRRYRGIPVMPTFHPSYLLRKPNAKRQTWEDLKQVIAELSRMGVRPPQPPGG